MALSKNWNNTTYSIPETGEFNWQALTSFLADLADYAQTTNFQKFAIRVATASPITVSAANDCVVVSNLSVAGPVAVTLPAGVTKQLYIIVDGKGDAATNNITITPASGTINGAASYVVNVNRAGVAFIFNGTEYTVFAEFGNTTSGTGNIPRNKLAAGTADHVVINDGSGFLSSEAQLAGTRGGTGASNAGVLSYGANNITITTAGATAITLPTSGTVATLAGTETLSNKTLASPLVSGGTIDVDAAGALTIGASVGANNITVGGAASTVIVPGNLTVQGTTTQVDTTNLQVKDANILVNDGGNDASAEGAGVTVERTGTNGSLIYKDASASKWAAGPVGSEVDLVNVSGTQTLTNKTIDGASNTLTNLPASGITGTLPVANGGTNSSTALNNNRVIQSSGGAIVEAAAITASRALVSDTNGIPTHSTVTTTELGYLGGSTSQVVTINDTQTITNKTLTAPIVDQSLYTEGASPATPAAGRLALYAKADSKFYQKNSAGVETLLGAGSGSGEINVIESPSDANGWVASGAGVTVATTSTPAELPLGPLVDTAIIVTPVSGTDYARYRFTMPASLKQRKLKIEWHQIALSGYASGDLKVEMWKNSASNYGGTYTEFPLSTDSSGDSLIPSLSGKYTTTFDADSSDYYELRIVRVSGTTALTMANVIVGPGIQPQGAVIGEPQVVNPPVVGGLGSGGQSGSQLVWFRYGRYMHIGGYIKKDGTAGSGAAAVTVDVPAGLTIDTSVQVSGSPNENNFGIFNDYSNSRIGYVSYTPSSPTQLTFIKTITSAPLPGSDMAANYVFNFECRVPIAEWAGGGTVTLAQNDVEYAYNTDASDASTTASGFGYGPSGAVFGDFSNARVKRVRFQSPILATDKLVMEYTADGGATWLNLGNDGELICERTIFGSVGYGAAVVAVNSTEVNAYFYPYRTFGATYGGAGVDWSAIDNDATYKWRIKKERAGAAIGFGAATATQRGLARVPNSYIRLRNPTGFGTTDLAVRYYNDLVSQSGTGISLSTTVANGTVFTINESGMYSLSATDNFSGAFEQIGFTRNASAGTRSTNILGVAVVDGFLAGTTIQAADAVGCASWTGYLDAGDTIRVQAVQGSSNGTLSYVSNVTITQLSILNP